METPVGEALQTARELSILTKLVTMSLAVPGEFVEVGVFRGGSAMHIESLIGSRNLVLIDPFGFSDLLDEEDHLNNLFTDFTEYETHVRDLIANKDNVELFKSIAHASLKEIAFAHIDVDSYQATLDTLHTLYPLLNEGGIIVVHDYVHPVLKVKDAVDLFVHQVGQIAFTTENSSQCLILK